jgi:preprotein translocase subunit SecE
MPAGAKKKAKKKTGRFDRPKNFYEAVYRVVVLIPRGRVMTYGQIAQWGALIVGLAAAVVVFITSEPGKEFVAFGRDSWKEVKKVVWPTRKETIQMTAYVIGFCAVMATFLWLTDKTLEWVFYDLILGWKK